MEPQLPLFRPFRALGYITDSVPFAVQRRGKESYVIVSVGRSWQLGGSIRALAAKGDLTFAAVNNVIVECKRVHRSGGYRGHSAPVLQLLVLGDHLISLGADGLLCMWRIGTYDKPEAQVSLPEGFKPTCMAHPDTYLNKLVVGSEGGQLVLLNFVTGKLLYMFKGWGSAVRHIAASPALDVVGCALADGRAALINLRFDETVVIFSNAAGVGLSSGLLLPGADVTGAAATGGGAVVGAGACKALAFRTGPGVPYMAAAGGGGVITIWNLEERRLAAVLQDAHDASLVALHFFAGEPLLMSAGADNSIKHWVFDAGEPKPRLLRFRSGHSAPPTVVAHYGEGLRLLSAGSDRAFRVFSVIQDQQSRELSQKHTARRAKRLKLRESELKLCRVLALDACTVRERDWANVITCHEGDSTAYVWRLQHFTLGEHELNPPRPPPEVAAAGNSGRRSAVPSVPFGGVLDAPVTNVTLSPCGNFGLVGTAAGRVDRYNMQSGIHRGVYGRPAPPSAQPLPPGAQQPLISAHDGAVTGIKVDSCNRVMVTTGLDGKLRAWDFKTAKVRFEVSVGTPITRLAMAASSGLVAVATDDLVLRVYDIEAEGRLVRRFKGHKDRITGLQLSADSRWLLSSSMDGSLRTWDVPAAQCLQVLRLGAPITAFSLAPAQDLLATCHSNRRGVYLWSNQAVFGNPAAFQHSERPVDVALPNVSDLMASLKDQQPGGKRDRSSEGGARIAGQPSATAQKGQDSGSDGEAGKGDENELGGASGGLLLKGEGSSDEDEGYMVMDEDLGTTGGEAGQVQAGPVGAKQQAAWQKKDAHTGAPCPLAPELVTLSLLPRSQWQSLSQLEAIKARNKPIEPPKKPDSAPFFLPTVAGLSHTHVFEADESACGQEGGERQEGEQEEAVGGSKVIRVQQGTLKRQGEGMFLPEFVRLLRDGHNSGDWHSFTAHLRALTPSALDREVRSLQLLAGSEADVSDPFTAAAVQDVAALLEALDSQLGTGANFEFASAVLQLVLQVHGDAIVEQPLLRAVAARLYRRLAPTWCRLDGLLSELRCAVGFFSNLQA